MLCLGVSPLGAQQRVVPAYSPPGPRPSLPSSVIPASVPLNERTVTYSRNALGAQEQDTPPPTLIYPNGIQKTGGLYKKGSDDGEVDFVISTDFPGPDRMFGTRDSEKTMQERIRSEAGRRPGSNRVFFPEEPPLSRTPFPGRFFPPTSETVEPSFVCHGRLYFEQKNFERAGWDLGPIGVPMTLAGFYYDVAMFPYHYWTRPFQKYDCNRGKCMPGQSTPFYIYPEELSVTGLMGLGATYTLGAFIFP